MNNVECVIAPFQSEKSYLRLSELADLSNQTMSHLASIALEEWLGANYHKLKQHYSD